MAILEKEVWVGLSGKVKYYEDLGYEIQRHTDKQGRISVKQGTQILVKIEDMPKQSNIKVTKVCDICGKYIKNQSIATILNKRKSTDGKDRCAECGYKLSGDTQKICTSYEKSLEYFSIENNMQYLLIEFSIKNARKPNEIFKSSEEVFLWNCQKCKSEYPMRVSNRTSSQNICGCPYCAGKKVNHTNYMWTTHPEIAKLLKDPQRGYEITASSHQKEIFICDKCKSEQSKWAHSIINQGFSCENCSDGISYPEKFVTCLLNQLETKFERQMIFDWSKDIECSNEKLCGLKKYDFYIPNLNCIIETHGEQHYVEKSTSYFRSLKDEQENDVLKEKIAKQNGIQKYIIINCSNSNMDFIKANILKSKLNELMELNNVDWNKCHEFACNTFIKVAWDLWNSGIKSTKKISEILKVNYSTVSRYLKKGSLIGCCDYNPKEVSREIGKLNGLNGKKKIIQLSKENEYIQQWESLTEASKSINTTTGNISRVCKGRTKHSGGYRWMYIEDYEKYIEQTQISNNNLHILVD